MVKKSRGVKVKILFQGLHMTHAIFVLVYNFIIYILNTFFSTIFQMLIDFDYKLILYHVYYVFMPSIT
jgi:hypothetical protein